MDGSHTGGRSKKLFVVMEFSSEFEDLFNEVLVPAAVAEEFKISKADSNANHQNIMATIVREIVEADIVIAEISTLNPNVMYEVGVAHALAKPTLLLTQDVSSAPFDLRAYFMIKYSFDFRDITKLRASIVAALRGFSDGSVSFSNPVQDFVSSPERATEDLVVVSPDRDSIQLRPSRGSADAIENRSARAHEIGTAGIVELQSEIETVTDRINTIVTKLGTETELFGANLRLEGERLAELEGHESSTRQVHVRAALVRASSVITNYSESASPLAAEMGTLWQDIGLVADRIDQIVLENDQIVLAGPEEIEAIASLPDIIREAIEQVEEMLANSKGMKGVARDVDRSLTKLDRALKVVIDSLNQGVASVTRLAIALRRNAEDQQTT